MNSPPLLITYYNNIPENATNYFTITDGTIKISINDMMGNGSSTFMSNANNNLVYILNEANMGSFIINSLVESDQKSYTYSINLNSIPLNLTDNILCVLSTSVPTYNINRTYMSTMTDNINNFSSIDNKKFIISNLSTNTSSSNQVDDTLFLYVIATNKSFNIIFNATTIITISNIQILPESNSKSIVFSGSTPPIKFIDNTSYTIYISTENSSTVSNIFLNNTPIRPLNYSNLDLTNTLPNRQKLIGTNVDMSRTPSNTLEITPVLLNQTLKLNNIASKQTPVNQCVILNITNALHHNLSGYFSFSQLNTPSTELVKGLTKNIVENFSFSNPVNQTIFSSISDFASSLNKKSIDLSNATYNQVLSTTGIDHSTVVDTLTPISDFTTSASETTNAVLDTITYSYKLAQNNISEPIQPDNINNVPLLVGLPCVLNVSYHDINNNQINFITPNIIIYLSNGLRTIIFSVSKPINSVDIPNDSTVLSFNGEINSAGFPDTSKNVPFVLSNGPISPYVMYSYINSIPYNTPIKNGSFTFMTSDNKLVINNTDANTLNAVPFLSLIYTIINTPTTLNILNLDYSIACSLIITGVALSKTQTTISYSLQSGNIPTNPSNYILTLLQSSDIISSINNTKLYNDILTKNNNLIAGIEILINQLYTDNPDDVNIQQAQLIIANASSQATILLTTPFINNRNTSLQIANATITMAFNAINYALLNNPTNNQLLYFYKILTQLNNPIIVTSILNNTLYHVENVVNNNQNSDNIALFVSVQDAINNAITQIAVPSALDSPTLNTPSSSYIPVITTALSKVNLALVSIPDSIDLLKAQSNLLSIEPIITGVYNVDSISLMGPSSTQQISGSDSLKPVTPLTTIITKLLSPSSTFTPGISKIIDTFTNTRSSGYFPHLMCCCIFSLAVIFGIMYYINQKLTESESEYFSSSENNSSSSD